MTSPSPFKGKTGFKRIWNAFFYSIDGFKAAFRHEDAFRQEAIVAVVFLPLAFWLGHSGVEKTLLSGSILLILVVELLNSGIEAVVDKASPEANELAKRAKDMGSAAVLVTLLIALITWISILAG